MFQDDIAAPPQVGAVAQSSIQQELAFLKKALEAGDQTGQSIVDSSTASGAPLKVESLNGTLKILEHTMENIVVWRNVPKRAAMNTVEEFNQLESYGADRGGAVNEGELAPEEDSVYIRRSRLVKFYSVTKSVTHPLTLVTPAHGPVISREVMNGTQWLLRKIDRSIVSANSDIISQEMDGLYKQHQDANGTTLDQYFASDTVIDVRDTATGATGGGRILSEADIINASNGIVQGFGMPSALYAPPKVLSDFTQNFLQNKFIPINTSAVSAGTVGQRVQDFESQFGKIALNWDIFMNKPLTKTTTSGATSPNAPAAPTTGAVTPVAATVAGSRWTNCANGNYIFAVSALNRFGESALTTLGGGTPATIVANGAVDLTFTATAGPNATSGFRIYRSQLGATAAATATFEVAFEVSTAQLTAGYDGAAAGSIRDRNFFIPGTNQAFLLQDDNQVWEVAQLAPLMKLDLAIISPAYRFQMLLYCTLLLYAPRKVVRFVNIAN